MMDVLISKLANLRMMAAERGVPKVDLATIDDAIDALKHLRAEVANQAAERVRATVVVDGEPPAKLREAIAQRVADVGKPTAAYMDEPVTERERAAVAAKHQSDAPICPWCDRQGHDICQHAADARTCGGAP